MKTNKRRTSVKELGNRKGPGKISLSVKDMKQVRGGNLGLGQPAAAKQLDATSQSGGPTAAQNQKIQE